MVQNQAAWAMEPFARLVVGDAAYTKPGPGQILVRNRAVAVNPVDRYKQNMGNLMFGWIKYPSVFGYDLAGEVVAVGPDVIRFKVGDRVLGTATGMDKSRNSAAEGAFQLFTLVLVNMAAVIPDAMRFEAACVLPLGLSTAASGLFGADQLGLSRPSASPEDQGQTVLIWGGSTSVGCNAIQLAKASGYRVVTTASPRNFDLVKGLGAAEVFDHGSSGVIDAIVKALSGRQVAGALAIGEGSASACISVLARCQGKRQVAFATFPLKFDSLPKRPGFGAVLTRLLPMLVIGYGGMWINAKRRGVKISAIYGTGLAQTDLGRAIFDTFLPQALQSGTFVSAPRPLVVGQGLAAVQTAIDRQGQGVSAAKMVVTL